MVLALAAVDVSSPRVATAPPRAVTAALRRNDLRSSPGLASSSFSPLFLLYTLPPSARRTTIWYAAIMILIIHDAITGSDCSPARRRSHSSKSSIVRYYDVLEIAF